MKKRLVFIGSKIRAGCRRLCERWKELLSQDRRKAYILAGSAAGGMVLLFIIIIAAVCLGNGDETVYREAVVARGSLTVGITESGNVSIGTSEQTFDLDISEYTGDSAFSFYGEGMGGQGMAQMFRETAASSSSEESRTLKVEKVYVTAGEEIEKGTPVLKLTDESVESIRQELDDDAADAEITYQQLLTSQKQVNQQAEAALASDTLYGTAAQSEYDAAVHQLQDSVTSLEEQLADKKEEQTEKTAELEEMRSLLTEQQEVLTNAEYSRDNTDRESDLYWWIVAVNTVNDTKELTESLEDEIENTQEELEQYERDISSLEIQLSLANKELASGKISAEKQLAVRQLNYENAQEIYDVTVGQSDFETKSARKDYEEAKQKLEDFDSIITEGVISSRYNGVITDVSVAVGDNLEQDSSLITLNDYEAAAITLEVDEEDIDAARPGSEVNISLTAFPDEIFKGEVTELGDAQINSNTNTTTYSVTVTVKDDASRLYEGMSAEVTFITKESEEVLQVSNRAVTREGTTSFVKVRNDNGKIVKKEIVTGFSDGINVEVKEGLSEGDIVLIESSVN